MLIKLAFAKTIHHFQGQEAGFCPNNSIQGILCDPGLLSFEQLSSGTFYTALSQAHSTGDLSLDLMNHCSNIYWIGPNILVKRIELIGTKENGTKPLQYVEQRDKLVTYLKARAAETSTYIATQLESVCDCH